MFEYRCDVSPEWIDHNGHMRDAYYGLVFSYAGVAAQEALGIDDAYRAEHGATIYLLEDHKFFLREVKAGADLRVETLVLDSDEKRFLLYLRLWSGEALCAVAEYMELHVSQYPEPKAAPMPADIRRRLAEVQLAPEDVAALSPRSGRIGIRR